jgi:uncharacterized protein with PIN domain
MEHCAQFRFYEELNDFLPRHQRKQDILYAFTEHPAVKDPIEALGVPHTEVDLIIVNDQSVGFDYRLQQGDRVAVYPVFESFDISPIVRLRPQPLRNTAFVLDAHLGTLARLLRLLGFDALYHNDFSDPEIIRLALAGHRIILTRDRRLLQAKVVTHGYWLRSINPEEQAREVLRRFDLAGRVQLLQRCPLCNGALHSVPKADILAQLEPLTQQHYEEFWRCSDCGKIYWRGAHYPRLSRKLERILGGGTG